MKLKKPEDMWCPMGRMSIQRIEGTKVDAVNTGAFNRVVVDQNTYLPSVCVGKKCALYRRGMNPLSWGKCAMARQSVGWLIVLGALIVAASPWLAYYLDLL